MVVLCTVLALHQREHEVQDSCHEMFTKRASKCQGEWPGLLPLRQHLLSLVMHCCCGCLGDVVEHMSCCALLHCPVPKHTAHMLPYQAKLMLRDVPQPVTQGPGWLRGLLLSSATVHS